MDQTVQKKSQGIRPFPGIIQKTSTTCSSWVLIYSNGVYLHNNLDVKVLWWQSCFSLQPLEAGLWVASKLRPLPCNHYGTKSSLSKPFLIVICHQRAKPKSMIGSRVIFAMSLTLSVSRKNNTFPLKNITRQEIIMEQTNWYSWSEVFCFKYGSIDCLHVIWPNKKYFWI